MGVVKYMALYETFTWYDYLGVRKVGNIFLYLVQRKLTIRVFRDYRTIDFQAAMTLHNPT